MRRVLSHFIWFFAGIAVAVFLAHFRIPLVRAQDILSATPVVPPINTAIVSHHETVIQESFRLDGAICQNCIVQTKELLYGGGAFRLDNTAIVGVEKVTYTGAAANTIAVVRFLESTRLKQTAPEVKTEAPITNTDLPAGRFTINLGSPYGQRH